ncbi:MAG: glycosyltransferase family 9 protein [Bacteroidetes bacterium]|nr:glycosyltransferase family 9 protein [Bacteroidota bacterium]MCH8170429.1 glycosyltransferase family 9 protein [Bacteroidota bacterium]
MQKILIIQTAFIGDAILTLPMIQKLKEQNKDAEIDVIAIPSTKEIFNSSPFVSKVIEIDKKKKHKGVISLFKFAKKLKSNNYTKIYSPHRSFRSAILTKLLAADESFSFSNSKLKFFYTNIITYKKSKHEVQRNLDLISFNYTDESWKIIPLLEINTSSKNKVNDFFVNLKTKIKFAAIAPGSIWKTKKYPENYYAAVVKLLTADSFTVFLIGGKDDENLCNSISEKSGKQVISVAGKFTLTESIEFLKRMEILISNDSAPTHLGVCANIPVLTIYCSTVPNFGFYPYNKKSSFMSYDNLECKPCGIHGLHKCKIKTFDCGNFIKPVKVFMKIKDMLNDRNI